MTASSRLPAAPAIPTVDEANATLSTIVKASGCWKGVRPLVAHRVNSRQRSRSGALGAKRTLASDLNDALHGSKLANAEAVSEKERYRW